MRVAGDSMAPGLREGDLVLVRPGADIRVGDIVLARHPYRTDTRVLKRVQSVSAGGCALVGDNAGASTDSRSFGDVPRGLVVGRAERAWRH